MKNFKEWVKGSKDIFNQDIEQNENITISRETITNNNKNYLGNERKKQIIKSGAKSIFWMYIVISVLCCILYFMSLAFLIGNLPKFGFEDCNITYNYVAKYYITHALDETKSVNAVTGMILDYRAFDTLGESFVLFSAVTCVFILLEGIKPDKEYVFTVKEFGISNDPIVKYVAIITVPVIFVFGIYVVLNGHISPGGGFSGGAIIGAGLILFSLAFGPEVSGRFFTKKVFKTVSAIALSGYAITKCYSFFMGGMHVLFPENYEDPIANWFHLFANGSIISGGYILILNICVGAVVACTMYGFYCLFKKGEI